MSILRTYGERNFYWAKTTLVTINSKNVSTSQMLRVLCVYNLKLSLSHDCNISCHDITTTIELISNRDQCWMPHINNVHGYSISRLHGAAEVIYKPVCGNAGVADEVPSTPGTNAEPEHGETQPTQVATLNASHIPAFQASVI